MASDYERNWLEAGFSTQKDGIHHLAMGLLSCFAMKLDVQKVDREDVQTFSNMDSIRPQNLFRWRSWPSPQVITTSGVGAARIIITDRMDLATSLVHEHFANVILSEASFSKIHYVVTSLEKIQCFTKVHNSYG